MNKKFLKALALVGCALLLVTASVVGTYAFLTAETAPIQNTFTAGNVSITLTESSVKNSYNLIPGKTYTKDPKITVGNGSESCWLFVKVEDGIAAIEDGPTIAAQLAANGWVSLGVENVYYHAIANAGATVPVFESFTIKTDANVGGYTSAKITVTAYAVQAEGFAYASDAWYATFGAPVNP